ncbi:MAG: hemoglobin [Mariniblastus sp.]|jgi:hemoglobin
MDENTYYAQVGGETAVRKIVDRFYDLMDEMPATRGIRAMHATSLSVSRDKLYKFLSGFLGGPSLYIEEYGHPMLRARHLPFEIGESERDQWMLCMNQSLDELVEDKMIAQQLKLNLYRTADHMRNKES